MDKQAETPIGIGSTVWALRQNYRTYSGSLLDQERAKYQPFLIRGETKVSWLIGADWERLEDCRKINKKTLAGIYTSWPEIEKRIWVSLNAYHIGELIQRQSFDYETLQKVAELIGYDETAKK